MLILSICNRVKTLICYLNLGIYYKHVIIYTTIHTQAIYYRKTLKVGMKEN